jgi:hypothetical protein
MIGKALTITAALLLSGQAFAQTNPAGANAAAGATSGPAAGSPATMRSPQAGPLATKHQRNVLRRAHGATGAAAPASVPRPGQRNDEREATGSSSPSYAPPPR